jgi:hypothetical protein
MLIFYIKTKNPVAHIEVCSFISYFLADILTDQICESGEFYGIFCVKAPPDLFEILSDFSENVVLEIPEDLAIK